jgi:hypothetical protein
MPPKSPGVRPYQFSISGVMIVVAVCAAAVALPRLVTSPEDLVARCLMALVVGFFLLDILIGSIFGIPCPVCSRWALRRLARHRHYYRCSACRARLKRYGLGPWLDASGPKDAAKYSKPTNAGVWMEFELPAELDDSTSGHLLQDRRSRPGPGEGLWQAPAPSSPRRGEEARHKVRAVLERLREIRE